jgi:hypothetical protein
VLAIRNIGTFNHASLIVVLSVVPVNRQSGRRQASVDPSAAIERDRE